MSQWPTAITRAPLTARTASLAGGITGPVATLMFLSALVLDGVTATVAFVAVSLAFGWLVRQASPALPERPNAELARVVVAVAASPVAGVVYAPILLRAARRWRPGRTPPPRPPVDRARTAIVGGIGLVVFTVLTAITLILPTGGATEATPAGVVPTGPADDPASGATDPAAPAPASTDVGVPGTAIAGSYASPSRSGAFTPADGATAVQSSCGQPVLATVDGTVTEVAQGEDQRFRLVLEGVDGLAHVYGGLELVQPSGQQGLQVQAGNPIAAGAPAADPASCTFTFALSTPDAVAAGGYRTRIDPTPYLQAWASGDAERSPVEEMQGQ